MGERKGDREAMERVADRMVQSGVRPDRAIEQARESVKRVDRQKREKGER